MVSRFHQADGPGLDLRPLLEDTLLSQRAAQRGLFRPAAVRGLVDEHLSRRADRTSHIWGLLMLELWLREFADSQPAPELASPLVHS